MTENVLLASNTVDLAEHDNYLVLTNRVCFYDEPNLNTVMLPSEGAEEKAKSLIDMPVVAKYTTNRLGEPTFKGHEFYLDEDGNANFGTESIGVHTSVYIAEDTVEMPGGEKKTLPCLFARYKVWKRNLNVVKAVRRLFDLGKLYSSWEIATLAYEYKDGIKTISDYSFLGNALLGYENVSPAYGPSAKAISLSALRPKLMLAQALAQDLTQNAEEDLQLKDETNKKTVDTTVADAAGDTSEAAATESAALTMQDLWERLTEACRAKLDTWCYVAYVFPEEKSLWVKADTAETELDYQLFTYEVEGTSVTVSEPVAVRLCVGLAQVNEHVETLSNAMAEATRAHTELVSQVAELEVYRDKYEAAERERTEAEQQRRQDELAAYAISTGMVQKSELAADGGLYEKLINLDKAAFDSLIASRLIASIKDNVPQKTETAEKTPADGGKAQLHTDPNGDSDAIMKSYLNGK